MRDAPVRRARKSPVNLTSAKPWRRVLTQAGGMALLAVMAVLPAVAEIIAHLRADSSSGVAPWAYVVLWLGLLQLGYAVYVIQLPDWSSLWVAAQAGLLIAAIYAVALGVGLSADLESAPVVALGLADRLHAGHLARWCLIMTSLSLLTAYLVGRSSLRWHRRHLLSLPRRGSSASMRDTCHR